jgi:hypothetical protein
MRTSYGKAVSGAAAALLTLLAVFLVSEETRAAAKNAAYVSREKNGPFSVTVSADWKQSVTEDADSTLYTYSSPSSAVFSVKVFRNNPETVSDIQRREFVSLLEKDHLCAQILDTDDYVTFSGTKSRISVYEYRDPRTKKKSILRKYFLKSGQLTYIFSCSAPIPVFYRNETAFSSILSSVTFAVPLINKKQEPPQTTPSPVPGEKPAVQKEPDTDGAQAVTPESREQTEDSETAPSNKDLQENKENTVSDDQQKETAPEVKNSPEESQGGENAINSKKEEEKQPETKEEPSKKETPPPYSTSTTVP